MVNNKRTKGGGRDEGARGGDFISTDGGSGSTCPMRWPSGLAGCRRIKEGHFARRCWCMPGWVCASAGGQQGRSGCEKMREGKGVRPLVPVRVCLSLVTGTGGHNSAGDGAGVDEVWASMLHDAAPRNPQPLLLNLVPPRQEHLSAMPPSRNTRGWIYLRTWVLGIWVLRSNGVRGPFQREIVMGSARWVVSSPPGGCDPSSLVPRPPSHLCPLARRSLLAPRNAPRNAPRDAPVVSFPVRPHLSCHRANLALVLPKPTRGVGHWCWVKGSTREHHRGHMGRWALVIRAPSGASGPCAYPLSEVAAGFAPQPREARGAGATMATWWDGHVSGIRTARNKQQLVVYINQSINQSTTCGEDDAAPPETAAIHTVNGLVPSPWARARNLGSGARAQPSSPLAHLPVARGFPGTGTAHAHPRRQRPLFGPTAATVVYLAVSSSSRG